MSLKKCIDNAQAANEITSDEALALKKRYDTLARHILAKGAVRERIAAELEAEAALRKRRVEASNRLRQKNAQTILNHRNVRGRSAPHEALVWLLEHHGQAGIEDVQNRTMALRGQAHAKMERLLYEFSGKAKITGDYARRFGKTAADMENVVRELFGESTGDVKASQLAKVWSETAEDLRQQFNAAGGAVGKLERWGLPQHHNSQALIAAGKAKWIEYITPLLAPDKMRHPLTGNPLTPDDLLESLNGIYDTIVTEGWSKREPTGQSFGKGALFNQHADHRFLHFKDADSWLKYQKDFGEGDPFSAMMGHVSTMTRDIAFMQVLGPNPVSQFDYLKQVVMKWGAENGELEKVRQWINTAENMFDAMRGSYNAPVNAKVAGFMSGLRNLVTASSLGSAAISALSDTAFQWSARRMAGIPQKSVVAEYIKQLRPGGQQVAVRAGLILDSALHVMDQQARYAATTDFAGTTGYIADRVLALSGLSPFTQAGKHAFGLDLMAHVADTAATRWQELTPQWRSFLERNGFAADDWSKIAQLPVYKDRGANFIRPQDFEELDRELFLKYLAMVHRFTKYAVPEPSVRARAAVMGNTQAGTAHGEFVRLVMQFKGFSVGIIFLHGMQIYRDMTMNGVLRGGYRAAALLTTMTILGALAMQLKELANGKDPRDMEDPEFWGAAFMQGGGIGIYGDFLFADVNRFGGGLTSTVAGPVVGRIDNLRNLTVGNVAELASDKETNFGREAVRALRQNTPGGNIWYIRLAYERILLDSLQKMADPEAAKAFRRQQKNRRRDYGQEYWWRPGETSPDRAPNLGAALNDK